MTPINGLFKALAVVALSFLAAVGGDGPAPRAAISMTTASPAAASSVKFVDVSEGSPTSWSWDFGDGIGSSLQNPSHRFASPGTYIVTLRATNASGSTTTIQSVTVLAEDTLRLISAHPFDITLSATDPRTGNTGLGQVVAQNDIYGIFSVPSVTGNAGNPEVIVKMVDASGIGASYWVFYGALTDLSYTLTVRDVSTGKTKVYHDAKIGTTVCGQFDTSGFGSNSGSTASAMGAVESPAPTIATGMSATAGSDTLTLMPAHPFAVTLTATDPRTGNTGQGQLVAQTDIYGIFSIPAITGNASNPEVIVKMVDASGIGAGYWVFYGALTDLNYTLSVREASTGATKTYNDAKVGTTVCGQFDTSGFAQAAVPTPTPPGPGPTPTPTPPPSGATTRVVNVSPNGATAFIDTSSGNATSNIHVGDTIQWVWQANGHSTTSGTCSAGGYYGDDTCDNDGAWDSGVNSRGATFSHRFTEAGTFRYYCSVHRSMMTGTVRVQ
jgi:PKD repeat protein